jgi:hypothetical protein
MKRADRTDDAPSGDEHNLRFFFIRLAVCFKRSEHPFRTSEGAVTKDKHKTSFSLGVNCVR